MFKFIQEIFFPAEVKKPVKKKVAKRKRKKHLRKNNERSICR